MLERLLRWFATLSQTSKLTLVIVVVGGATVAGIGTHAAFASQHSTKNFCKVYSQEKAKYINSTNSGNVGTGLTAVLGIPQLFDRLDRVAPSTIEPDVANIRDSLKRAEEAAGNASLNNPLAGLGGGLVASLESAQSWQNVANFVDQNCPKTPAELAAIKAQQDKSALDDAGRAVYNGVVEINGAGINLSDSEHPLGLTSQLDADLQSLKDAITQAQRDAKPSANNLGATTKADCENLSATVKYTYDTLVVDIKQVKENGWPPAISDDPTSPNPTTLRQRASDLQQAIAKFRALGGDPASQTPNSESPDQTVAEAQALADRMDAEIEYAKTHTPDWYVQQLTSVYTSVHLGGICG
jgi:hypothetical protein